MSPQGLPKYSFSARRAQTASSTGPAPPLSMQASSTSKAAELERPEPTGTALVTAMSMPRGS